MKVKDLIKELSEFNPEADVKLENKGVLENIEVAGWCCEEPISNCKDIKERLLKCDTVVIQSTESAWED